jgi:hypothetical protein
MLESLYQTIDTDPEGSITRARSLKAEHPVLEDDVLSARACIFVDAGGKLRDQTTLGEGVALFRQLLRASPDRADLEYNLANGLWQQAVAIEAPYPIWYLRTSALRREARLLLERVGKSKAPDRLRAKAKANHGNLLWHSHRWLEAYEQYRDAVLLDETNLVASSGAARLLLEAAQLGMGAPGILEGLAKDYVELARSGPWAPYDYPTELQELIKKLPDVKRLSREPRDLTSLDPYAQFVANERLALTLTIEGHEGETKLWDSLLLPSVSERLRPGESESLTSGVPAIFAMINELKADYLAARWSVYTALEGTVPETGQYADTLDYANYGVREGLLRLGQRAAIDTLDRVAVTVTEYLRLPATQDSVMFTKRWLRFRKGKPVLPFEWQQEVAQELTAGNRMLIALSELAEDVASGGALDPHQTTRSGATHGFIVLHEMGATPSRESRHVRHENFDDFVDRTLRSLRIARSAIVYLMMLIAIRERRESTTDGLRLPLHVPLHHHIRGE